MGAGSVGKKFSISVFQSVIVGGKRDFLWLYF